MISNSVVTCAEMKEIERKADEKGLSYYQMMENAGNCATEYILCKRNVNRKKVCIFCGKGNNGGDGFVVARKLFEREADLKVVLIDGEPTTEDAIKNKQICEELGIEILDIGTLDDESDIIVDAIYGTGFHGAFKEKVRAAAKYINISKAEVFSLDIPSGLNGDSGIADEDTVCADHTIVFHSYKPVHVMDHTKRYCGQMICVDIGIE